MTHPDPRSNPHGPWAILAVLTVILAYAVALEEAGHLRLDWCRCGHPKGEHGGFRGSCRRVLARFGWNSREDVSRCECQGYEPRALRREEILEAHRRGLLTGFIAGGCLGIIPSIYTLWEVADMTLAKGDRLYKVAGEPYEVLKRVRDWAMQPGHVWDEDALRGILTGRTEAHTAFEVLEPGRYAAEELPTDLSPVVLVSTPVVEGVKLKVRS